MLVVADTSPFIGLIKIGHVEVLPALFGRVFVPPEVARELGASERAAEVRLFIGKPPSGSSQFD
jgi:predicted nucleic acid-binding protein